VDHNDGQSQVLEAGAMKAFIVACIAAAVVAIVAAVVLDRYQKPAEVAYSSPTGVRI
jgi:hypothetical protein